VRVNNRIYKKK